jgi:hypothetical protein
VVNRYGTKLAQITVSAQLIAKAQYQIFPSSVCATGFVRNARPITPINFFKLTVPGSTHPSLHRREAYMKLPGYRSHRDTATNNFYHGAPSGLLGTFLLMLCAPEKTVFADHTDIEVLAST